MTPRSAYIPENQAPRRLDLPACDKYDEAASPAAEHRPAGPAASPGDVAAGKIDVIVVYKVDRLTRSLMDFAKLVELFDKHGVSFVSVTQPLNTTTSMGASIDG